MLTPFTQAAIAVLDNIYMGNNTSIAESYGLSTSKQTLLLRKLEAAGLIYLYAKENPDELASYKPTHTSLTEVSLLDILQATNENLDCNQPLDEEFYSQHGRAALKLGIVNQLTRSFLQDIKLFDL